MEIIISARHFHLGSGLKDYVEERIVRIAEECEAKLTTARVILSAPEHGACHVEIHLNGKHIVINSHAEAKDTHSSIDMAIHKLEKQLRKHLEKIQEHRVRKNAGLGAPDEVEVDEEELFLDEVE